MSEPESISTKITTYSLDGSSWKTKHPPMCEVETSTIPTELLEAYVELLRAGQRELDEAEFLPGTNFENAILQVIRAGGGK